MRPDDFENKNPELENTGIEEAAEAVEETAEKAADGIEEAAEEVAEAAEEAAETTEEAVDEAGEAVEETAEEAAEKTEKKGSLLGSNRFKRGGMATLMSVVFVAIIIVINVLVSLLTARFPSMNIDLTAKKLHTLSDQSLDIARGVQNDTEIFLIGDEDAYREDRLYSSYGIQYSQVANLAERLAEASSHISVKFIDPDTNPTFIGSYEENLTSGCVLVRTDRRHKVLGPTDFFAVQSGSSGYSVYSNADAALAGALEVVNLDYVPVLTIATGHNEVLTSKLLSGFTALLEDSNFDVKEIDMLTEEIPEDTQLLMIPTPTTDYTGEEISKIRAYLEDSEHSTDRALLVSCMPIQNELPVLESFLEEWGFGIDEGVVAETDSRRMTFGGASYVLVDTDEEILTENTYNSIVSPQSRPITLLFAGNGDVSTKALWTTSDSAFVATENMTEADQENIVTSAQTVAAIAAKYVQFDKIYRRRAVMVFGSTHVFTTDYMTTTAFGDKNYISDLMKYVTGTDDRQVTVASNQVQTNEMDIVAPASTVRTLGLMVFTIGIPVAILVIGLVIFLRRRHL